MPEMSASPLISAYVRLEEDFYKLTKCKLNSKGLSSLMIKQLILQSYSPKISVLSTPLANEYACKFGLKNFLELLNYFEDSLYQQSSILTNKVHVRFLKPIDELLRDQGKLQKLINDSKRNISGLNFKNNVSTELFNLNTLEESSIEFARHIQILKSSTSTTSSTTSQPDNNDNILLHNSAYLHTIAKILSSSTISPFETFNHPILQLLVVSAEDTLADAKKLNSDWKYLNYPKWIDIDKILPLFVIVVDSNSPESLQRGLNLQEQLKLQLNIRSIILPLLMPTEENKIDEEKGYEIIHPPLLASLAQQDPNLLKNLKIPTRIKNAIKNLIVDIINKTLVPYMNRRVNILTEEVVNPRKSFTGRLFNVGKRWGSGASSSSSSSLTATQGGGSQGVGYNALENFYYPKSSEFLIRQLADWLFMLKDYKTSYTTYELLKKDFLNEKSWNYLASLQEFMIISLLIGASNKFNNTTTVTANSNNNNGITSKIIDDLIVPMVDSLHYSYTSRCYLKTFSLRSLIIIGELFITLTESNQFYNHSNLNNSFYCEEAVTLFNKVIDNNLIDNLNKSYLMERISYVYDNYYYLSPATIKQRTEIMTTMTTEEQDQQVPNFLKKNYEKENYEILGFTRHRKSELWFKLAIRQFEEIKI